MRPTSSTPEPTTVVPASSPLRVLHLDTGREWRGGQRQVELLATGLRARGHEPLVVVTPRSPLHRHLKTAGVAVAAIPMRNTLDLLAVRRLRRLITTWRPAIVHAHDARSQSLAMTALVGRRNSIPLVVTRRSAAPPRGVLRRGPRVSGFIAISDAVRDALVAAGVEPARVARVYPGVSPSPALEPRDWRTECGWEAGTVVAGVLGELATPGAAATLESIAQALPAEARDRLRFVLLGGRAAGHQALGGVPAFRAGFVHDIHRAIAGVDLMLHSGTTEGLGTAVIDGMAFGAPCVAFAGGSVAEVIEDGRTGALVPRDDVPAFARAVARLVTDGAHRDALAAAGRERSRHFEPARFVEDVLRVYRDLVERSKV
jgi:glycosyltransferase involved in cell wall biosynthesis